MTLEDMVDVAERLCMCGICLALPGNPCVTKSGKPARHQHWTRSRPIYEAWRAGYKQGSRDELLMAGTTDPEWWEKRVAKAKADYKEGG